MKTMLIWVVLWLVAIACGLGVEGMCNYFHFFSPVVSGWTGGIVTGQMGYAFTNNLKKKI